MCVACMHEVDARGPEPTWQISTRLKAQTSSCCACWARARCRAFDRARLSTTDSPFVSLMQIAHGASGYPPLTLHKLHMLSTMPGALDKFVIQALCTIAVKTRSCHGCQQGPA